MDKPLTAFWQVVVTMSRGASSLRWSAVWRIPRAPSRPVGLQTHLSAECVDGAEGLVEGPFAAFGEDRCGAFRTDRQAIFGIGP